MKIDFITFITRNSSDYAEYLKYTAEKFLSKKHEIKWKCIESVDAERLPKGYKCVAKSGQTGHNSMNHGAALNLALDYIETDYVIFIDADMAILYQNWDEIVIDELRKCDCFGAAYDDVLKYRNFPMIYFLAFRSSILNKVKLDFNPKIKKGSESPLRYKLDKKEAKYFGKKPGELIKCDTGWKFSLIMKQAGLTGNSMKPITMKSKKSQLPFENSNHRKFCMEKPTHMCEWHYNNKLFVSHKQASRSHPLDENWGKAWKKRIELYLGG